MHRLALVVVVFMVTVVVLALWLMPEDMQPQNRSYGKALIGGDFSMIDHNGQPFSDQNLKGHYNVLYFGFTHCPDICPAGLLTLVGALESLPDEMAKQVQPIFVTVDPKRDTQKVMAGYVANFHPSLIGLTGTDEQVRQMADAYKVYYQVARQSDSATGYLVDHSGYFYLMGPDGAYVKHFPHNVSEQVLAGELRDAIH